MDNIFLDASTLAKPEEEEFLRAVIKFNSIKFEFPDGFSELPLIEELRALNAIDIKIPENFDLMYDITMQMLNGKSVKILWTEEYKDNEICTFLVNSRYMDLRSVDVIRAYPIIVNWLVEFVAGYLGKKYPRSLEDMWATMGERKGEPTNQSKKEKKNQKA